MKAISFGYGGIVTAPNKHADAAGILNIFFRRRPPETAVGQPSDSSMSLDRDSQLAVAGGPAALLCSDVGN